MANNIQKLIKLVNKKLNEHKAFNDASTKFENAVKKTRDHLMKRINNSTIIQELKNPSIEPEKPLPYKIVTLWKWYQQLVGLHTVEKCRQQVLLIQDSLYKCQEKRRYFRQEAFIISNKTKEIYNELLRTKRDDPKYVSLTITENKNLQEQTAITKKLTLLEEEEKDRFVQLTTAIKEYHDAQIMSSHRYKYVSILASVIAAILSLICSTIYNNKRIDDMKVAMSKVQENNKSTIIKCFDSLQLHVDEKLSKINKEQSQSTWLIIGKYSAYVISSICLLKVLIGF
ncbi:mitochondrial potassium channel-like isoform X1 [Vespula squamosa]|uniref:Mitochondrial potassium channel-like isoform X1 n=1 Tax=Vespula squamosa TaxID=30214 RepID=A0ABD1ZYM7_VESSQ